MLRNFLQLFSKKKHEQDAIWFQVLREGRITIS